MNVLVLHEPVADGARADELDVLQQVAAVRAALSMLGHTHHALAFEPDSAAMPGRLRANRPDVVFNLVETVDGSCRDADLAPRMLRQLRLPFTGASAVAMRDSTDKLRMKQVLHAHGLPTPRHFALEELAKGVAVPAGRYIVKSVAEHGSLGLEDDCVLEAADARTLHTAIAARLDRFGGAGFAEEFVAGREFNLALLAHADGRGVDCLPPAEIAFAATAAGATPLLVGYRAKWASGSAEDEATPRCFDFAAPDAPLLARVQQLALDVWRAFDLAGYARVDLRVDQGGRPFVIDVNTNPCLSPDAGYAAAVARAGLTFAQVVERLLAAARQRT